MTNAADQPSRASDDVVYCRAAVVAESLSDEDRSVDVIASTSDLDGHGTRLKQNWRLDRFRANPVVLFSHNSRDLPIGTASDVRITDGQLRAKLEFSTPDLNPFAEQVWRNVKAKTVRGVSVGFMPHSVKFEKENDRDIVTLDDNELFEISMTPVPSNPATLAQLRARAIPEPAPVAKVGDLTAPPTPPAAPAAQPEPPETKAMTTPATEQNHATPTVCRALGLPAGAPESDVIAACTRLRELEVQVLASTGAATSGEGIGALRGLVALANEAKTLRDENLKLRSERDKQNFEAQVSRGLAERKLSPPLIQMYRDEFAQAEADGRGAQVVARIKGHVDVGPTLHGDAVRQPAPKGSEGGAELTHNGKSYRDMKPMERHRLWQSNPELWRLMKEDFEANRAA